MIVLVMELTACDGEKVSTSALDSYRKPCVPFPVGLSGTTVTGSISWCRAMLRCVRPVETGCTVYCLPTTRPPTASPGAAAGPRRGRSRCRRPGGYRRRRRLQRRG